MASVVCNSARSGHILEKLPLCSKPENQAVRHLKSAFKESSCWETILVEQEPKVRQMHHHEKRGRLHSPLSGARGPRYERVKPEACGRRTATKERKGTRRHYAAEAGKANHAAQNAGGDSISVRINFVYDLTIGFA